MKNRDGYTVELSVLDQVDMDENGGCSVRQKNGWSLFINASELDGFVPQVGDVLVVYTQGFNTLAGLAIDGRVFRYRTPKQIADEHEQWKKNYRLDKLERYLEHGEALKERVKNLHPVLQARMERFSQKDGIEFWIDSAPYEMACLEGAQALLNATVQFDDDVALKLVEYWEGYNTQSGGYQYVKQMELVPDFGDGHSGNTAGAAVGMAKMILRGEGDKL